jgi:acyl-CoA reductase-like NAD-dependent aldehyde dehydrogenase
MNTKTKELIAQAIDHAVPETWTALTPEQVTKLMNKVAELLVIKVAEFVDDKLTNSNGASMAWCDGSDIKEHFGVTE